MKQFGGDGKPGKRCELRRCKNKRYAAPENVTQSKGIISANGSVSSLKKDKKRRFDSGLDLGVVTNLSNKRLCPAVAQGPRVRPKNNKESVTQSSGKTSIGEPPKSRKLLDCPFRTTPQPAVDNGLNSCELRIVRCKPSKKTYFLASLFPGRCLRVESSLTDVKPERTVCFVS